MNGKPIICFGQQPCGFFPKRFLVAKINTARALQKKIGGKIVFFYHDSDADYRETITIFHDSLTGQEVRLNFTQENKVQKKFSPLYLKRIPVGWKQEILKQLPRLVDVGNKKTAQLRAASGSRLVTDKPGLTLIKSISKNQDLSSSFSSGGPDGNRTRETLVSSQVTSPDQAHLGELYHNPGEIFTSVNARTVGDFCLEMYQKMGLLNGVEVVRSSDKSFREQATDIKEGFADIEYQGEIVRAKIEGDGFSLHEGGGVYTKLPKPGKISKSQISPAKDERFGWMNSVIHCTYYIYGEGEKEYLKTADFPEVKFIDREKIDEPNFAWLGNT